MGQGYRSPQARHHGWVSVPRWFTDTAEQHSQYYLERFRRLAAEGADLGGEARLLDAIVAPHSRILDAGCGIGRTGAVLHARGHEVVGVDVDPLLVAAARADHPGPQWCEGDLATLELDGPQFDAAIMAGNVLLFVAPDSEPRVLERLAAHVRPDGVLVTGFALGRGYDLPRLDADAEAAGWALEHRFATWDLRPWTPDADYAVSVLRRQEPQHPAANT